MIGTTRSWTMWRIGRTGAWRAAMPAAVAVMGVLGTARPVHAQWAWPEHAQDLRELPADFPPDRLRAVMLGFTNALGVRCSHCHVGEEGAPLETYDFVSNANPNKDRARAMYRMLGTINRELADIEPSGARVNMWCHTCHNGKPRPQTLAEALDERWTAQGGEATLAYFMELRDRYWGAAAYDLTPGGVAEAAAGLRDRDPATARRLLETNLDLLSESAEAWEAMGDFLAQEGDETGARTHYGRALQLDPGNERIADKLRRLG